MFLLWGDRRRAKCGPDVKTTVVTRPELRWHEADIRLDCSLALITVGLASGAAVVGFVAGKAR